MLGTINLLYYTSAGRAAMAIATLGLLNNAAKKVGMQPGTPVYQGTMAASMFTAFSVWDSRIVYGIYQFTYNTGVFLNNELYIAPIFSGTFSYILKPIAIKSKDFASHALFNVIPQMLTPENIIKVAISMGVGAFTAPFTQYKDVLAVMSKYGKAEFMKDSEFKMVDWRSYPSEIVRFLSYPSNIPGLFSKVPSIIFALPMVVPSVGLKAFLTVYSFKITLLFSVISVASTYIVNKYLHYKFSNDERQMKAVRAAYLQGIETLYPAIPALAADATDDQKRQYKEESDTREVIIDTLLDYSMFGDIKTDVELQMAAFDEIVKSGKAKGSLDIRFKNAANLSDEFDSSRMNQILKRYPAPKAPAKNAPDTAKKQYKKDMLISPIMKKELEFYSLFGDITKDFTLQIAAFEAIDNRMHNQKITTNEWINNFKIAANLPDFIAPPKYNRSDEYRNEIVARYPAPKAPAKNATDKEKQKYKQDMRIRAVIINKLACCSMLSDIKQHSGLQQAILTDILYSLNSEGIGEPLQIIEEFKIAANLPGFVKTLDHNSIEYRTAILDRYPAPIKPADNAKDDEKQKYNTEKLIHNTIMSKLLHYSAFGDVTINKSLQYAIHKDIDLELRNHGIRQNKWNMNFNTAASLNKDVEYPKDIVGKTMEYNKDMALVRGSEFYKDLSKRPEPEKQRAR